VPQKRKKKYESSKTFIRDRDRLEKNKSDEKQYRLLKGKK